MNPGPKEISQNECCLALQAIPDLIFQIKDDGTFLNYKGAREDLYVPPEQFIGKNVKDVLPEQLARQTLEYMGLALESQKLQVYEYNLTIGEHLKYFEARMIPYEKDKVLAVVRDITGRQDLETAVAASQRAELELSLILDSSPIIIFYKDQAGKFIRVNQAFAEALKLSKEAFLGKTVFDLYSSEIAQGMTDDDQAVMKSGKPKLNIIERYQSADGIRWVRTDKIPIYDKNKTIIGLVGFAQDITEQKQAEDKLKESEEKYRNLVENSIEGIGISRQGRVVYANKVLLGIFGYENQEEFLKIPILEHVAPDSKKMAEERQEKRRKGEPVAATFEYKILRRDGKVRDLEVSSAEIAISGEKYVQSTFRDITEQKRMQLTLQEKVNELKLINNVAVGRELKLIELEKEVDRLLNELGRPTKYK